MGTRGKLVNAQLGLEDTSFFKFQFFFRKKQREVFVIFLTLGILNAHVSHSYALDNKCTFFLLNVHFPVGLLEDIFSLISFT